MEEKKKKEESKQPEESTKTQQILQQLNQVAQENQVLRSQKYLQSLGDEKTFRYLLLQQMENQTIATNRIANLIEQAILQSSQYSEEDSIESPEEVPSAEEVRK